MTGVLSRLVARATGAVRPGMVPRLPARFEAGTGPDIGASATISELPEPGQVQQGDDAPEASQQSRVAPSAAPDTGPLVPRIPGLPTKPPVPTAGLTPSGPVPPVSPVPEPLRMRETRAPRERQARSLSDPGTVSPQPLLPSVPAASPVAPEPSAGQPVPEPDRPVGPVPVALLARAPEPTREDPATARPQVAPRRMQPAIAPPEPPEIVIHIGRVDIRSDAAPARREKTQKRRAELTPLADYLRGRDGQQ